MSPTGDVNLGRGARLLIDPNTLTIASGTGTKRSYGAMPPWRVFVGNELKAGTTSPCGTNSITWLYDAVSHAY